MSSADVVLAVTDAVSGGIRHDESFETMTIDVPAADWVAAASALRDDPRSDCRFFDWLSAYDDRDAGLAVLARVYSLPHRHGVIVRTHVDRSEGRLPTLTSIWAGADWHERETFEMFGIDFVGHPNLVPLLLPNGFEGNPLRKEFVLASRVAKEWPGRKEPGESDADGPSQTRRRVIAPPGVPEPGTWGPQS
jgi:NADH-quinone oxidoreductase subunit C